MVRTTELGAVYFVREIPFAHESREAKVYVKVGSSKVTENRIGDLQTGNPRRLVLFKTILVEDRWRAERKAQQLLWRYRVPGQREWFELPPDMVFGLSFESMLRDILEQEQMPLWDAPAFDEEAEES